MKKVNTLKVKKGIFTTLRIALALFVLGIGIYLFFIGFNWRQWCPDHEVFIPIILGVDAIAGTIITGGIYLICPIFFRFIFLNLSDVDFEEDTSPQSSYRASVREYNLYFDRYFEKYLF